MTEIKNNDAVLKNILGIAKKYRYEHGHAHQVAALALSLFDQLQELHKLDASQRILLHCAAILHDIGWIQGRKAHHKVSRDLILKEPNMPLSEHDKVLVALIARYHRRALPKDTHPYFSELDAQAREVVEKLAALLRIADGLDIRHEKEVTALSCEVTLNQVRINIQSHDALEEGRSTAKEKADLFEKVFGKQVVIV